MSDLLLFRPIPYEDETAASLLIRAAEENGYGSVYQLLSGAGILINEPTLRACIVDTTRFENLVRSLGLTKSAAALALARLNPSRRSPRRYREMLIEDNCFRHDEASAFCSACLNERQYWRQQWLIRPFSACARHQLLLLDRCCVCSHVPAIGRGQLTRCTRCGTSFLTMSGAPTNIDSISAVEEMVAAGDAESLKLVLEFWAALARFDWQEDQPASEYFRLELSIAYLRGEVAVVDHVAAQVTRRLPSLHPRIQLVHFLSGSGSLVAFAEKILARVPPLPQIGDGNPRLSQLSKGEVCRILRLSAAQLTHLISSGELRWPTCDGRQQKIATTEVEYHLHGFTQSEREYGSLGAFNVPVHRYDRLVRRVCQEKKSATSARDEKLTS
ncbi:TniQ family protein [Massilia antarctica]|uniref:TniQ family protein n=1 Tax=Massilia antarctica TaxID=2765360 RepID=UPI00226F34ED|nr:TniQ family protein [Massilia sp. H27-R4]MCY0916514.1 TniQ family protein [Massilia sp. H27-R4]